jgi:DNA-binding protein VF530
MDAMGWGKVAAGGEKGNRGLRPLGCDLRDSERVGGREAAHRKNRCHRELVESISNILPASPALTPSRDCEAREVDHASDTMHQPPSKDPLHGITLQTVVTALVDHFGWDELGRIIDIRCFNSDPSISSSLKFLRKTPWARKKVEDLYLGAGLDAKRRDDEPK